jgi:hypothetical protein
MSRRGLQRVGELAALVGFGTNLHTCGRPASPPSMDRLPERRGLQMALGRQDRPGRGAETLLGASTAFLCDPGRAMVRAARPGAARAGRPGAETPGRP